MALNVQKQLAALQRQTVTELKRTYEQVFGEACRSNHRQWLVRRIIWRMQANSEGDLSERARRRAEELANDADLRMKAPPERKPAPKAVAHGKLRHPQDRRLPMPGTVLAREYKGRKLHVTVLPDGFEHEGEVYPTLSAVAKAITGSHCNGFLFFRLGQYGGER